MFAASKSGSAAAKDPQFNYVTMLLHGDGTNGAQNNTFLDSSTNNFTITRNGNTTQGTFSPYGSNWSNYFDGSGDYLSVTDNAAFDFGTGDFTIECWLYRVNNSGSGIFEHRPSASAVPCLWYITNSTNYLEFYTGTSYTGNVAVPQNQWVHVAVSRQSGTLRQFINGQVASSNYTVTTNLDTTGSVIIMGSVDAQVYNGYCSNFRILKGTALYTSAFTPPTSPLTAITNTSLLTCQSNRFIDNSTNNFTITKNGDTSVQRFSPFSPTTAYSTSVIGGSGYFDGSGDYLNTPSTGQFAPTGDFTISCWYYPTSTRSFQQIIGNFNGSASTVWIFEVTSGTGINFYTNGISPRITGSGLVVNAWNYLVLTRSGSTITGYVNGVSLGTYAQSGTFGSATQSISIGRGGSSTASTDFGLGYIADVKLIDGSAVTTIPTAPQTATSGTNLLLSYTNAGILDNAMMNDLETVGNAQISTSVKKYGSGSIAMTASGDYCKGAQPSIIDDINGGDFTIEFWVNFTSLAADRALISKYGNTAENAGGLGYVLQWTQASSVLRLVLGVGGGTDVVYNFSWSPSISTWYHVAVTRSGSSARAFVNGTQIGSTTTVSTSDVASPNPVQIGKTHTVAQYLLGYMDDVRITKGYARYTANFTPPTSAFPNN